MELLDKYISEMKTNWSAYAMCLECQAHSHI